eukprot:6486425-Alexandrium_andersonii.AAC.1
MVARASLASSSPNRSQPSTLSASLRAPAPPILARASLAACTKSDPLSVSATAGWSIAQAPAALSSTRWPAKAATNSASRKMVSTRTQCRKGISSLLLSAIDPGEAGPGPSSGGEVAREPGGHRGMEEGEGRKPSAQGSAASPASREEPAGVLEVGLVDLHGELPQPHVGEEGVDRKPSAKG